MNANGLHCNVQWNTVLVCREIQSGGAFHRRSNDNASQRIPIINISIDSDPDGKIWGVFAHVFTNAFPSVAQLMRNSM